MVWCELLFKFILPLPELPLGMARLNAVALASCALMCVVTMPVATLATLTRTCKQRVKPVAFAGCCHVASFCRLCGQIRSLYNRRV